MLPLFERYVNRPLLKLKLQFVHIRWGSLFEEGMLPCLKDI